MTASRREVPASETPGPIVVDSSVWVAALRDRSGVEGIGLARLLDLSTVALVTPVKLEILGGAKRGDLARLRRALSALPCWAPDAETWNLIDTWIDIAVKARERFGIADLLIAAIAEQHGAAVWSLDRDFERLARLDLIHLHGD